MTKFVNNASGAIWWPNLEVMQPIKVPLKSILKYLTWILIFTEDCPQASEVEISLENDADVDAANGAIDADANVFILMLMLDMLLMLMQIWF